MHHLKSSDAARSASDALTSTSSDSKAGRPSDHHGASNFFMKIVPFASLLLLVFLAGCTAHDRSPDAIREQTAHATSTAARDAKAVAQGVVEGIKQQRTINLNKASVKDLESLPGIDEPVAQRIIDHRPYSDSYDLVKRHILSRAEYDRIAGKVETR
jgi:hypothetical protein